MYKLNINFKKLENNYIIFGILSYLYLFYSLLNNNYNIIFIYFFALIIGYFIINKKMFIFNFGIIIYDILNKNLFSNIEGANFEDSFEDGKDDVENNDDFNNDVELPDMSEEEGNNLGTNFDKKIESDKREKRN